MKIKGLQLIAYLVLPLLICVVIIFFVFLVPACLVTTSSTADYLMFHDPVIAYLHTKDYFLPDHSIVGDGNKITYSYAYKKEDWKMDQFFIHLTMIDMDTDMVDGYIDKMKQLDSKKMHLKEEQDVWFTIETEKSIKERMNLETYDGLPLFYFFMLLDDYNTVEFWVCKIEDAGEIAFPEFTSFLVTIASYV